MPCKLALASMRLIFISFLIILVQHNSWGQDSNSIKKIDTLPRHNPRLATKYSALLPGLGQIYNKQYWKLPIVYGALAIPVATYIYNDDLYNKTKFAYTARFKEENGDNSDVAKIDPVLKNLSLGSLQSYRNGFRKDRDYSILWFILGWGLNVVDATVSGHLKEFDVSSNLAISIKPMVQPQFRQSGLSLQLHFKNVQSK
ncbi:MAG: hypothetical protein RI940_1198 [Bacteroidota bacterium]